ncbi:Mitochondrial sodium/hydrogen exchanger NHA2 [Gryllus bimaculatus]|nr:Mitochondrial sodium/hydrogen exchanger NHA2 [Gryllus bimaculatus]
MTSGNEQQEHLSPMLYGQGTGNDVPDIKQLETPEVRDELLRDIGGRDAEDGNLCYGTPQLGSANKLQNDRCSRLSKWFSVHLAPEALCHTPNFPLTVFSIFTILLLLWGTAYTLFQDHVAPSSSLFILFSLFILAYIAGRLIFFLKLPPLLGMLLVGIIIGNVNIFNMEGWYKTAVSTLRALQCNNSHQSGLDAGALQRLSFVVIRLAFVPCLVEASVVACVSHFLLDLPWLWGALLGMIISPAVVVPSLLALKDQGYGEDKGIATLVIAASSIDDILAISGFGVILSTIFSEGDVLQQFLQGPLESWVVTGRSLMVGLGGLFAVFGSQLAGYSGAGPLASIVMAFVACYGWKKQGWSATNNPVESVFTSMWQIFQPVLFGLIGTAINLSTLEGHAVIYGIATLCVGLSIRLVTSFLNSTVQAAIGPVALDLAEKWHSDEIVLGYASLVLTIAVLSIIITAPLGAIGIYIAGPRLLGKVESEATPEAENEEDSV